MLQAGLMGIDVTIVAGDVPVAVELRAGVADLEPLGSG
jgi:hypothetical protein